MQTGNVSFGKVRPIIVDRTIDKSFRENLEKKAPAAQNNYRLEDFTDYYAKQNFLNINMKFKKNQHQFIL